MWLKQLRVENLRCFEGVCDLTFSKTINVFIGENSSGKSTLISAIGLPEGIGRLVHAARKKEKAAKVELTFEGGDERVARTLGIVRGTKSVNNLRYQLASDGNEVVAYKIDGDAAWSEPKRVNARQEVTASHNIYFPFLSRRKSSLVDETFNLKTSGEVRSDFKNLYARIQPLLDSGSEFHDAFMSACEDILGFKVHGYPSNSGMTIGLRVDNESRIALTEMGEGVLNILGLLVNIFSSDRRIFLIEELENDLHIGALKKLLTIIIDNVNRHQFFISTHNSVILRYLSAHRDTKVFEIIRGMKDRIPTSVVSLTPSGPGSLLPVASRLGADFNDTWLFDGYLILEESSAESIIREILVPHFTPSLNGRLRTVASGGTSNLFERYTSSQSLFLFAHLSPVYKTRCWVRADSDLSGREEIDKLRKSFPTLEKVFGNYSKECFEYYYPAHFASEVTRVLAVQDKRTRRDEKAKLLKSVLDWARDNPSQAKEQFSVSAAEVIDDLKYMAEVIDGRI